MTEDEVALVRVVSEVLGAEGNSSPRGQTIVAGLSELSKAVEALPHGMSSLADTSRSVDALRENLGELLAAAARIREEVGDAVPAQVLQAAGDAADALSAASEGIWADRLATRSIQSPDVQLEGGSAQGFVMGVIHAKWFSEDAPGWIERQRFRMARLSDALDGAASAWRVVAAQLGPREGSPLEAWERVHRLIDGLSLAQDAFRIQQDSFTQVFEGFAESIAHIKAGLETLRSAVLPRGPTTLLS